MRRAGLALAAVVALSVLLSGITAAIDGVRNDKLAKVCRGEGYPNTWAAKGAPTWATEERMDALCAVQRWLLWETGWSTVEVGG